MASKGRHYEGANPRCREFGPHPRRAACRWGRCSAVAPGRKRHRWKSFPASLWHGFPADRRHRMGLRSGNQPGWLASARTPLARGGDCSQSGKKVRLTFLSKSGNDARGRLSNRQPGRSWPRQTVNVRNPNTIGEVRRRGTYGQDWARAGHRCRGHGRRPLIVVPEMEGTGGPRDPSQVSRGR